MKCLSDLGIRAILAILLTVSLIIFVLIGREVPETFINLVCMAVAFYFSNRSTMDKM